VTAAEYELKPKTIDALLQYLTEKGYTFLGHGKHAKFTRPGARQEQVSMHGLGKGTIASIAKRAREAAVAAATATAAAGTATADTAPAGKSGALPKKV
jgi:hypothetical protein